MALLNPTRRPVTRRWPITLLLLSGLLLSACPVRQGGPSEHVEGGGPSDPDADVPPEALAELEQALSLMEEGALDAAQRKLERVLAQHPDSPASERAALLQAVIQVRGGGGPEATQALRAAAEDDDLSLSVRRTAAAYLALRQVQARDRDGALELLRELYPGNTPPTLVAEADRQPLLMLLVDARRAEGDPQATFEALSWLYQLGDARGREFARGRGLALARTDLDPDVRERLMGSPDDFTRGYASVGHLEAELEAADGDGERVQALRAALAELAPILARLNDGQLIDALETRLGAFSDPTPLRIGALLPLSGSDRRVGQRALGGLLVAQGAFRGSAQGGVTLAIEDTSSSARGAASGVKALAAQGVSVIIGPLSNAEAMAAAREAESLGVPLVAMNLDRSVTEAGPHTFRLFLDSRREVEVLLGEAARAGARRVAVLYPDVPLGRDVASQAREVAEGLGVSVVEAIGYKTSATDFSKLAREVRAAKASAVLVPDVGTRVSLIMPYLAAEQLWCTPPGQDAGEGAARCSAWGR